MAYNPFDFFRRNQKTFFAVLTVFIMFTFVLSFGQGDFFSSVSRWFGARSGETLAVIDGHKVTEADVRSLRVRRNWANTFMMQAHFKTTNRVEQFVIDGMKRAGDDTRKMIEEFLSVRTNNPNFQNILRVNTEYLNQQQLMQILQQQISPNDIPGARQQTMQRYLQLFQLLAADKSAKADDRDLAQSCQRLVSLDAQSMFGGSTYFNTVPLTQEKTNGNVLMMEFELWLKKADKLGVAYTRADADRLIQDEFYGQLTTEDRAEIENAMLNKDGDKGFTRDHLKDALIDELKVRTAMTVVLGPVTGAKGDDRSYGNALQSFAAPYDQFKYYKKMFDQTNYAVVSVPVVNFVDKVTGEPTVQELNDLFKAYKSEEPSPDREKPGLKEPRKLKLEWLEIKGDEPYYKAKAKEYLPKLEWLAKASGMLTAPLLPNVASVLAAGAPLGIEQPALYAAYQEYTRQTKDSESRMWFPEFGRIGNGYTDRSVVTPWALAATVAAEAAGRMTLADPFEPVTAMSAAAMSAERDARIRAGAALLLPPMLATPYIVASQAPQPLPLSVMANDLRPKVLDLFARQIAFDDIEEFNKKLTELGKPKDRAPARDYLEQFIKARGLKTGASNEFHDMFSIGDDPGLKPLVDRSNSIHQGVNLPNRFGPQFFLHRTDQNQISESKDMYDPMEYPAPIQKESFVGSSSFPPVGGSTFLVWRTSELPAETPRTLDARTKAKAIAAWKRIKARDLAKAKAEEMAKAANGYGNSASVIRQKVIDAEAALQSEFDSKVAKDRVKFFYISPVAELIQTPSGLPGRETVVPFQINQREEIPYPEYVKMRADLLDNRDKPLSKAFVMADRPKDLFYVTVLESRDEKSVSDFGRDIYAPLLPGMGIGQQVLGQFSFEQRMKMREEALALLKIELHYENENPDLLKKSDSSSD